ncbi:hypothetical protein FRC12_023373, partial [Ceratobasidium sp. 428]
THHTPATIRSVISPPYALVPPADMHKPIPSSPVLFNAQLWSNPNTDPPAPAPTAAPTPTPAITEPLSTDPPRTPSPPASPLSRRSVTFQEISPFISVDPSAPIFDAFAG